MASILRRLGAQGHLVLVPAVPGEAPEGDHGELVGEILAHSMVVVHPDGRIVQRGEAVRAVVKSVPVLSWLRGLWALPGAPHLVDAVYDLVARNRHRLGCSEAACGGSPPP